MVRFPLNVLRVKNWGGSFVVSIPPTIRAAMHLQHGDLLAVKIFDKYLVAVRWPRPQIISLGDIPVDALPPLSPKGLKNAETQDNQT